jgi:hypothetical protein
MIASNEFERQRQFPFALPWFHLLCFRAGKLTLRNFPVLNPPQWRDSSWRLL